MDTRFSIKPSQEVPGAGMYPIMIAYPQQELMVNDINICCEGMSDHIPLNSTVLKLALLNSPYLLRQMGLEVRQIVSNPTPPEVVANKKKAKEKK